MSDTVTKQELVKEIAERTGRSESNVGGILQDVLDSVQENLRKGRKVQLTGFGVFEVRRIPMRTVRAIKGPNAGRTVTVPAAKRVGFRQGEGLKRSVNQ